MAQAATFDELLNGKTASTKTVRFILDSDLADQWDKLESRKERLETQLQQRASDEAQEELDEVEAEIEKLKPEVDAVTRHMKFQAVGRLAYQALEEDHPATAEDKKKAKAQGLQTPVTCMDTFAPALLAASCIEPEMTETQATQLYNSDKYNAIELHRIFYAAIEVNTHSKTVQLGKD